MERPETIDHAAARRRASRGTTLCALVAAACLAGCSGAASVPPPAQPSATPAIGEGLLIGGGTGVSEYGPSGTKPVATLTPAPSQYSTAIQALAVDSSNDVYASSGDSVQEYAPTTHRTIRTIAGFQTPALLAVDRAGNLFVVDDGVESNVNGVFTGYSVREYPAKSTTASRTITSVFPYSIALDGSGNLYLGDGTGTVSVFAPGARTPARTIAPPTSLPANVEIDAAESLAVDSSNDLYVYYSLAPTAAGSSSGSLICEYAPGGSSPIRSISTPPNTRAIVPESLAIDSSNALFAFDSFEPDALGPYPLPTGYSSVEEIAPGSDTPSLTIQAVPSTYALSVYLAVDRAGNAFVSGTNTVEYAAGTATVLRTIANSGVLLTTPQL